MKTNERKNEMIKLIYDNSDKAFYKDKNINSAYVSGDEKLPLLRFKCFDEYDWMDAVFSTKIGGVSTGYFSSMNLDIDGNDEPENVENNFEIIADALKLLPNNLIKTDQIHKTTVSRVQKNSIPSDLIYKDTDGLYTDENELALCISGADCVPVLLCDTMTHNVAAAHSGWRGTVQKIGKVAVEKLVELGGKPENIVALIGPSISQKNYEVTIDVVEEFKRAGFLEKEMKDIAYKTDDIHYQLDLWAACFYVLKSANVNPKNIHFSSVCTYDNHEILFSHRYTNGLRGTMRGIIYKTESLK